MGRCSQVMVQERHCAVPFPRGVVAVTPKEDKDDSFESFFQSDSIRKAVLVDHVGARLPVEH